MIVLGSAWPSGDGVDAGAVGKPSLGELTAFIGVPDDEA
jgi:hypothetical protein